MTDKSAPTTVQVGFWGTNSLAIKDGNTTILVDPYFSRVDKKALFLKKIEPNPVRITQALDAMGVDKADAILVTHTHFDHALDIVHVAKATGAVVYGSESAANICRGGGLPEDQIHVLDFQSPLELGNFTLRCIPGKHLAFPWLLALLLKPGRNIEEPLTPPARSSAYAEGTVFSVHFTHPSGTFFNQGSANWIPGSLKGCEADIAFLGVGGLDLHGPEYWDTWYKETAGYVKPEKIYWTHWDDFCVPLNQKPGYLRKVKTALDYLDPKADEAGNPPSKQMPWQEWMELF